MTSDDAIRNGPGKNAHVVMTDSTLSGECCAESGDTGRKKTPSRITTTGCAIDRIRSEAKRHRTTDMKRKQFDYRS